MEKPRKPFDDNERIIKIFIFGARKRSHMRERERKSRSDDV
jgi:hypothetical protein